MHYFCFNDCIPDSAAESLLVGALTTTLIEYSNLFKVYSDDMLGIATSNQPSKLILNSTGLTLHMIISNIKDKEIRGFGHRIFDKYPVDDFFAPIADDEILEKNYEYNLGGEIYSGINHAICGLNGGILFTLALHDLLKKDILDVSSASAGKLSINNLYGEKVNTVYIQSLIKQSLVEKLDNYDKLLNLIGENACSSRFKTSFNKLSGIIQSAIISHIEAAINRNGNTKFFADGLLVKDVTPDGFKYRVFELRIFDPAPYRMYFYEAANKTYLAFVETKPPKKTQSNQIKAASSSIEQLVLINP